MILSGGVLIHPASLANEAFSANPTQLYYGTSSLALIGRQASYSALYTRQLWVYTVVGKRARATARLPLKTYRREEGRPEERDHPYAELLRRPNPKMSPFLYWLTISSTFDIYGEAIVIKVRNTSGRPIELWPVHPANVHIKDEGDTRRYVLISNPDVSWPAEDVIHHRGYSPTSSVRGLSPLEPLRQTLQNEDAARRATSSFWEKGARPGYALSHPGTLSDPAQQRLKSQFDSIAAGADNTGATVVLEEGMKPETLTLTAEEAQYIETRKLNREEVCAAYDMPPTAVGILDNATYSNIAEQLRSVYRDTMAPHLKGFESDLVHQLGSEWGDEVYAEFLMDEVLRGDFEVRQEAYRKADYMTIAEKRRLENLPHVDGTDRIIINAASVPLDSLDAVTDARAQSTTVRTVMGRLSRVKDINDVDPDWLVDGLNGSATAVRGLLELAQTEGDDVDGFRDRLRTLEVSHG